jgi:hypothetical protein
MGAGLPAWLGWVVGTVIFTLALIAFGMLAAAAWRDLRSLDDPPPSPFRPSPNDAPSTETAPPDRTPDER